MFWTWIKKQNCIIKCHFLVQSQKFLFLAQISIATSKTIWSHCIRFYCAKKNALSGCRSVDVQKAKHVSTIQWHLFSNKVKEKLTFWPTYLVTVALSRKNLEIWPSKWAWYVLAVTISCRIKLLAITDQRIVFIPTFDPLFMNEFLEKSWMQIHR